MAMSENSLSKVSAPRDSASAIRKLYEGKNFKMKPEHPGGRTDFFLQVEYTVKAIGGALVLLTALGAWYGTKKIFKG